VHVHSVERDRGDGNDRCVNNDNQPGDYPDGDGFIQCVTDQVGGIHDVCYDEYKRSNGGLLVHRLDDKERQRDRSICEHCDGPVAIRGWDHYVYGNSDLVDGPHGDSICNGSGLA
jgi:hypothetical protein